jgi:hypothetical protein
MGKKKAIDIAIDELTDYFSSFSLKTLMSDGEFAKSLKSLYESFHPLLIWCNYFRSNPPEQFPKIEQFIKFQDYFEEMTSDLCQAIFLYAQGLYKPGLLLIRSSIENFLKCIGLFENKPVLEMKSVYDLFDFVKRFPIIASTADQKKEFDRIHTNYIKLCAFVHTKDNTFMSFTTALGHVPSFDRNKAGCYLEICQKVISSFQIFIAIMFVKKIKKLHHSDQDLILDNIPKRIKKQLFS